MTGRNRSRKLPLFFVLIGVLTIILYFPGVAPAEEENPEKGFDKLFRVYEEILDNYVDEVDPAALERGAIRGMLESLDPYSQYFTPEEFESFEDTTSGVFGGVGMRIEKVGDYVRVVAPLADTPAERAGIMAGDRIIKVDKEEVIGYPLKKVASMIKGEPGTTVNLTVLREGEEEPLVFTIEREIIKLEVAEGEILDNNLGYIRLNNFSPYSVVEFKIELEKILQSGAEALILDLRNNPGGYLHSALAIADEFVDKGEPLLKVVSRDDEYVYKAKREAGVDIPVAVLINKGSASASEILAGAIRDHGKGVLVGTRSFGKASVQSLKRFPDGSGYKLTTAKYLTPAGRDINDKGLEPDYNVEVPEEQLEKAKRILLGKHNITLSTIKIKPGKRTFFINGTKKEFPQAAFLQKSTLMVPLRCLVDEIGGRVKWIPEEKVIAVEFAEKTITIKTGSKKVDVGGTSYTLSKEVTVKDGTTFIPVRFLEVIDGSVKWNGEVKQAIISIGE